MVMVTMQAMLVAMMVIASSWRQRLLSNWARSCTMYTLAGQPLKLLSCRQGLYKFSHHPAADRRGDKRRKAKRQSKRRKTKRHRKRQQRQKEMREWHKCSLYKIGDNHVANLRVGWSSRLFGLVGGELGCSFFKCGENLKTSCERISLGFGCQEFLLIQPAPSPLYFWPQKEVGFAAVICFWILSFCILYIWVFLVLPYFHIGSSVLIFYPLCISGHRMGWKGCGISVFQNLLQKIFQQIGHFVFQEFGCFVFLGSFYISNPILSAFVATE